MESELNFDEDCVDIEEYYDLVYQIGECKTGFGFKMPIVQSLDLIKEFGYGIDLKMFKPQHDQPYDIWNRNLQVGIFIDDEELLRDIELYNLAHNSNYFKAMDITILTDARMDIMSGVELYKSTDIIIIKEYDVKCWEIWACGKPVLMINKDSDIKNLLLFMRENYISAVQTALEARDWMLFNTMWEVVGEHYANKFLESIREGLED